MPTRPRSCNRKTTGERANMIRKLGLIAAVAGAALAAQAGGVNAQRVSSDGDSLLRCDIWNRVPRDPAGTQRSLTIVQLAPSWNPFHSDPEKVRGRYVGEDRQ